MENCEECRNHHTECETCKESHEKCAHCRTHHTECSKCQEHSGHHEGGCVGCCKHCEKR